MQKWFLVGVLLAAGSGSSGLLPVTARDAFKQFSKHGCSGPESSVIGDIGSFSCDVIVGNRVYTVRQSYGWNIGTQRPVDEMHIELKQ